VFGLIAWINAWHYLKKMKKFGGITLWQKFYSKEKKKIFLTVILTLLFIIAFRAAINGYQFPNLVETVLFFSSLPWAFGDSIKFIIDVNIRRYLPVLSPINNLGWIIGLTFEIVLFFYISRIVFWRPKKTLNSKPKA